MLFDEDTTASCPCLWNIYIYIFQFIYIYKDSGGHERWQTEIRDSEGKM